VVCEERAGAADGDKSGAMSRSFGERWGFGRVPSFSNIKDKTPFNYFHRRGQKVIIIMTGNPSFRTKKYGHNTYYLINGRMI